MIPDEIIWQILENANRAPNHKQTEPWRFSVFSGEGLKYFGKLQSGIYKRYSGESFNEGRYKKLIDYSLMSSHVIAIGMKRNETNKLPEIEEIEAVACAVQNMFLTVTAYGLGSYWTTAGVTYFEEAKSYFHLNEKDKLLGFFYIGYVAKPLLVPSKRRPIQEKVNWTNNCGTINELFDNKKQKIMKKVILTAVFATASLIAFQACNNSGGNSSSAEIENTDVVPSGTYTGTADKVDPDEKEVYVKTTDGKTLELYFTDQTTLTQNGQTATFDALKEGQNLEVTVEKKGKRLEPIAVKIME